METYLILNVIFLAVVMIMLFATKQFRWSRSMTLTLGVLLVTTAIFDSLLIAAGIVVYEPSKILAIYIGLAPLEDFFYAILAVIVIPTVWHIAGGKRSANS